MYYLIYYLYKNLLIIKIYEWIRGILKETRLFNDLAVCELALSSPFSITFFFFAQNSVCQRGFNPRLCSASNKAHKSDGKTWFCLGRRLKLRFCWGLTWCSLMGTMHNFVFAEKTRPREKHSARIQSVTRKCLRTWIILWITQRCLRKSAISWFNHIWSTYCRDYIKVKANNAVTAWICDNSWDKGVVNSSWQ